MLLQEKKLSLQLKQANIHGRLSILRKAILRNKMASCGDKHMHQQGSCATSVADGGVNGLEKSSNEISQGASYYGCTKITMDVCSHERNSDYLENTQEYIEVQDMYRAASGAGVCLSKVRKEDDFKHEYGMAHCRVLSESKSSYSYISRDADT